MLAGLINLFGVIIHTGALNSIRDSDFIVSMYGLPKVRAYDELVDVKNDDGSVTQETVEKEEILPEPGKLTWFAVQLGLQVVGFTYHYLAYKRMKPADPKYQGYA